MNRRIWNTFLNSSVIVATVLVLVFTALGNVMPSYAASLVGETFTNSTAAGWLFDGDACLTAGSTTGACETQPNNEGDGNGWLRLTENVNDQRASAIYNTAFSSSNGNQVTFQYASYGGSGADGFSFYLIDGATATPTIGGVGGALGYAFDAAGNPGVTNGYLAIGFDEYGSFLNSNGSDDECGLNASGIKVAGSGNLAAAPADPSRHAYDCLAMKYLPRESIETVDRAGARWVRITIAPSAATVKVETSPDKVTWTTQIVPFSLPATQVALPATFKMGFSAATGGATNFHEIRNLDVTGAQTSTTSVACLPNPSTSGQSVTCTATVSGSFGTPTGLVDFYDGTTLLQAGVALSSGEAAYTTSALTVGNHTITAYYAGDPTYAASANNTAQQVKAVVAFNADGGSPTPVSQNLASGSLVSKPSEPTRAGYTFANWYNGAAVWDFANDTVSSDMTLTAHWTINTYTVTYDGNGNTAGNAPVDGNSPYDHGYTVSVLGEGTLVKAGYSFAGWTMNADGSGSLYAPGNAFNIYEHTTLYAQWTANTAPEIDVTGLGVSIADGDTTPDVADDTDFGAVAAGSPNAHTFTITNTGDAELNLSGTPKVALTGDTSDFTVTLQPTSPVAITSGTTTFTISFAPTVVGLREATVSIANNDADENPYTFDIQGTGTLAILSIDMTNIDFGDQLIWGKTAPVSVTITNDGTAAVTIGSTFNRSSGKFLLSNNTCAGATLAAGATCSLDLAFKPDALRAFTGKLTFTSDAANSPHVITLIGNGVEGTQLLLNRSFELTPGGVLTGWVGSGLSGIDGSNTLFAKSGRKSVSLTGTNWTIKSYTQTINRVGAAGDDFRLTAWSMADAVPAGYLYRAQVSFYSGGTLVYRRIKDFNSGTHDWENVFMPFYTPVAYDSIAVEIIYRHPSGSALFDNVSLYYAP